MIFMRDEKKKYEVRKKERMDNEEFLLGNGL
jgi:hypothetical protein